MLGSLPSPPDGTSESAEVDLFWSVFCTKKNGKSQKTYCWTYKSAVTFYDSVRKDEDTVAAQLVEHELRHTRLMRFDEKGDHDE